MALVLAITWQCSRRPHLGTVITSSVRIEDPISFPGQQDRVDPQPQHEHNDQELQWRHREQRSILWIDLLLYITSNELKSRTSAVHSFRLRNRIHRMEAEENYILKYEMLKCWALICFRWKFPREWVCLIWMSDFSNLLPTQSDNLICIYPGHKTHSHPTLSFGCFCFL